MTLLPFLQQTLQKEYTLKLKSEVNWALLFQQAKEQAVIGILYPIVENCYKEKLVPKSLFLKWYALKEHIQAKNKKVNAALIAFINEMNNNQIRCLVVKGQVAALEYEDKSTLRQSGDIDLYVHPQDWEKLQTWLKNNDYTFSSHAAEKHIEINYHGVDVELHHHLIRLSSKKEQSHWQNIENTLFDTKRTVMIEGTPIPTIGVNQTALYLLMHIQHHLLTEGIGLRQLCDFTLFLQNHKDELDSNWLNENLIKVGHKRAFTAFTAVCVKFLGLKPVDTPLPLDSKDDYYAVKLMEDMMQGGNFGHKNNLKGVKPGLLHSLNTAKLVFIHALKFYPLTPNESRHYWFKKIFWRMQRKTNE